METREPTTREKLIIMAALSGGLIKRSILTELCDNKKPYAHKLQYNLHEKGQMQNVPGSSPRCLKLEPGALEFIRRAYPKVMLEMTDENGEMIRVRSDMERVTRRCADISQVFMNMEYAGIPYIPDLLPPLSRAVNEPHRTFYSARDVKKILDPNEKFARGSRLAGLLLREDRRMMIAYNIGDGHMKFVRATEEQLASRLRLAPNADTGMPDLILFGDDMSAFEQCLVYEEDEAKLKRKGADMGTFQRITYTVNCGRMYFILNGELGTDMLRLVADKMRHEYTINWIMEQYGAPNTGTGRAGFGRDSEGRSLYILLPFDLKFWHLAVSDPDPIKLVVMEGMETFIEENIELRENDKLIIFKKEWMDKVLEA